MVFLTDLARALQVPTPTMDAVVRIASVILARDLVAEGTRTMATMGLADLSREELLTY